MTTRSSLDRNTPQNDGFHKKRASLDLHLQTKSREVSFASLEPTSLKKVDRQDTPYPLNNKVCGWN
jgi:hypothetical protein